MGSSTGEVCFPQENGLYVLRAHLILSSIARRVLYQIFSWGCVKDPDTSVREYLLREKQVSNMFIRRCFTGNQISQMDKDPEGTTYDITLLYRCIQIACRDIADAKAPAWSEPDTLEYTLQYMKNKRNQFAHEVYEDFSKEDLLEFVEDIKIRIRILYEEAGRRYDIQKETVEKLICETVREIDCILERSIRTSVDNDPQCELEMLVRDQGKLEVQKHLNKIFIINCSSEIPGFSKTVDVHDFFTPNNLVSKINFGNHSGTFTVQDILDVRSRNGEIPSVIVVEGLAGAGKTTLVKVLLSHWCKETDFIRNLKQYDLILFSEFRNPACTDIKELFLMHMPKTFQKMTGESLVMAIMNLKILVIIDGFEEMNKSSQNLLIHFIHRLNSHKMQLLITTRPNRDEALYKMIPKNLEICHLEIVGVPQDRLTEFVLKWHNIMKSKSSKGDDVSKLCAFIQKTPWCSKLMTHPLNLTLLIFLWTQAPRRTELLKTSTSLYNEIVKLMTDRLLNRIYESKRALQASDLRDHLSDGLKLVFRENLNALRHENFAVNDSDLILLKRKFSQLNLSYEDILSAFFTLNGRENSKNGNQIKVFGHKGFCEFYGALALCDLLKRGNDDEILQNVITDIHEILISNQLPIGVTRRIRRDVQKTLKRNLNKTNTVLEILQDLHYDKPDSFSLSRYQKVLIHLIGLLKLEASLSEKYASELVDLLKETNLTDSEEWLNILTETDCEVNIVPKVREILSGKNHLYVRDGHLKAAACVLQNLEFQFVNIDTFSDPGKLGYLKDVLKSLSSRKTCIHLSLLHHWQYPEQGWSDDFLHCLLKKNKAKLTHFKGSVKSLPSLSKQTEVLYLALGTPYAKHKDQSSDFISKSLADLEYLYIHITGGIAVECLPDLPEKLFHIDLWFSGIDDASANWVANAVEKLARRYRPFWSIRFPRSTLTTDGCIKLAKLLKGRTAVGKDGVIISSKHISQDDVQTIETAFLVEVSCSFHLLDEVRIWSLSP
ncbi:uncharacterized protein [Macrobrachium rosenbergii]|uniref:uncharacterized protein n=1 Tax=Macrobrachium rosenbergii TaxID=79674 RepID=UPI0034D46370